MFGRLAMGRGRSCKFRAGCGQCQGERVWLTAPLARGAGGRAETAGKVIFVDSAAR